MDREAKPTPKRLFSNSEEGRKNGPLCSEVNEFHDQLTELDDLTGEQESVSPKTSAGTNSAVSVGEAEQFSQEIEDLLRGVDISGVRPSRVQAKWTRHVADFGDESVGSRKRRAGNYTFSVQYWVGGLLCESRYAAPYDSDDRFAARCLSVNG